MKTTALKNSALLCLLFSSLVFANTLDESTITLNGAGDEIRLMGAVIKVVEARENNCIFNYYSNTGVTSFSLKPGDFKHGIQLIKATNNECIISTIATEDEYLTKGLDNKNSRASPILWILAGLGILAVISYYGKKN